MKTMTSKTWGINNDPNDMKKTLRYECNDLFRYAIIIIII